MHEIVSGQELFFTTASNEQSGLNGKTSKNLMFVQTRFPAMILWLVYANYYRLRIENNMTLFFFCSQENKSWN